MAWDSSSLIEVVIGDRKKFFREVVLFLSSWGVQVDLWGKVLEPFNQKISPWKRKTNLFRRIFLGESNYKIDKDSAEGFVQALLRGDTLEASWGLRVGTQGNVLARRDQVATISPDEHVPLDGWIVFFDRLKKESIIDKYIVVTD